MSGVTSHMAKTISLQMHPWYLSEREISPEGPLVRRVLDGGPGGGGGGAGGDLRLGVDGFRLLADLLCRMSRQYQVISALVCNTFKTLS